MLGLLFLLGFAILILSALVAGLIVGLIVGLARWAIISRKGALFRLAWPPILLGMIGSLVGCLIGLSLRVQQYLLTCQSSGPDCQFEAASQGFNSGLLGAGLGAIAGAVFIVLILTGRQLFGGAQRQRS